MVDFNIRSEIEKNYINSPDITNELDLFFQEIDLLFNTEKMEVFGNNELGSSIEDLLWKTTFSSEAIKNELNAQIKKYCYMAESFNYNIDVKLVKGNIRDIAEITINVITKDNESRNVVFLYN